MMKTSFTLVFICYLIVTIRASTFFEGNSYVEINNNLPAGTTLTVHCKSKDDDLGIHHITRSWGFTFVANFFGGTLFFCSFSWPGRFEWFDIYWQERDWRDCNQCIWMVSENGLCRLSYSGDYDVCHPWNAQTQSKRKPLMRKFNKER
ncbi:hypothetical protein BT93_A0465 [Corymbia citriodora subsp. variegata]|nr:hypothetical protein BT93_A0465 [Corymbia citriodora subsp. variegata]